MPVLRTSLRRKVSVIAIAALSLLVPRHSEAAGEPGAVPGTEGHVYRSLSPVPLQLYVFKPAGWKSTDSRAALIWFHGSGDRRFLRPHGQTGQPAWALSAWRRSFGPRLSTARPTWNPWPKTQSIALEFLKNQGLIKN